MVLNSRPLDTVTIMNSCTDELLEKCELMETDGQCISTTEAHFLLGCLILIKVIVTYLLFMLYSFEIPKGARKLLN